MIKLEKSPKPEYLVVNETRLTEEFNANKEKSVWSHTKIKETLLDDGYSKCAYCESKVGVGSSYMEVEHFLPKEHYPDLVVSWENLLPSCKKCNGMGCKGSQVNKSGKEILNPFEDNPADYLIYRNNRFRAKNKSSLGKRTINVFKLNGEEVRKARFDLTNKIDEILCNIADMTDEYEIRNKIESLLKEIQPDSEFSAVLSTVVHAAEDFLEAIAFLKERELWTNDLTDLYDASYNLTLLS